MQNNAKIIEALSEVNNPIDGYFWNDESNVVKSCLTSFNFRRDGMPRFISYDYCYKNFSLTDPNAKKLISTRDEARVWAEANSYTLVRTMYGVSVASDTDFEDFYRIAAQTGLRPGGSPIWTPITEIEVV
jgi:hypothetical protein